MAETLSIIIPVFNAEQTLIEAVDSIYRQPLKIPFEIVIVDDGSSDNSRALISTLASQHSEISYFFHEINKGGGAARNTAVRNSRGKYVFCLDSDDIMGENMLMPMVTDLVTKKLDGVGVHISKKFSGKNIHKIAFINSFGYSGKKIPFESLFEGSECALYSTFLHTRTAFDICGGYPTHHGFDTQGFAFRFLANGLNATVTPKTTYLHRINAHRSYYLREAEAGRAGENCLKIYEEFLYLFSPKLQHKMLANNLRDGFLFPANISKEKNLFIDRYQTWIKPLTQQKFEEQLSEQSNKSTLDLYWLGCRKLSFGDSQAAVTLFLEVIRRGESSERIKSQLINALVATSQMPASDLFSPLKNSRDLSRTLTLKMIQKRNDLIRIVRQFI